MTEAKFPEAGWPTETYYIPTYKMSQYINGEGIQMYHAPAAITDTTSRSQASAVEARAGRMRRRRRSPTRRSISPARGRR